MDIIKIGPKEVRRGSIDWIDTDRWHALVSMVMNIWGP